MPLSEAAILVYEQKQHFHNALDANFDRYVINFICTNLETFTIFSAIFTRINHTIWSIMAVYTQINPNAANFGDSIYHHIYISYLPTE